jgi:ribosomal protein L37AE/L43A
MIKIKSQEMSTKTEVSQAVQADGEAAHLPIPRIMASFDMDWQVRSSGRKYGSCTGHAMLIGAHSRKIMDSIVYNKRCTICNKHKQRRIETGQIVKKHECMKNYDGTSKSMKAAALVSMLCHTPQEKGVSIKAIISDDDSNGRKKAQHIDRGGQLPTHVEEPKFFADPSHRKRVFARAIYNLANASMKVSRVTKGLASHIKFCYGACIKWYWHLPADELSAKAWNVLEHISGKHEGCCESFCYDKKVQMLNVPYRPPADHRICAESDVIIPIETEVAVGTSGKRTPLLGWNATTSTDHQDTYNSNTSDEGSEDDERDMLVSRIADGICLQGNEYE